MWDLEYLLLFGLPNNKLELLDGITPLTFPFPSRRSGEEHFEKWVEQLARWRNVPSPVPRTQAVDHVEADVGGAKLQLYRRPIRLALPMAHQAWDWLHFGFWRHELWEGQPQAFETGWKSAQHHWGVKHKVWELIDRASEGRQVTHCGGVDVMLSDRTAVAPDHCFYDKPPGKWMIGGDYYAGPPDLVAEVMSPSSRAIDRGLRMDLYAEAGVPELWLLDPEIESVEIYKLVGRSYALAGTHMPGGDLRSDLFPGFQFPVREFFETHWGRRQVEGDEDPKPLPKWFMPTDMRLGLEYLFLFGHSERRYEIWNNQAPCMLAFGSEEESQLRFRHFLEDICRWENSDVPVPTPIEPGTEAATVGRFRLLRRGRHVRLNVAVEGAKYRALLETSANRDSWDWGE